MTRRYTRRPLDAPAHLCTRCEEVKPADEFRRVRSPRGRTTVDSHCRPCRSRAEFLRQQVVGKRPFRRAMPAWLMT